MKNKKLILPLIVLIVAAIVGVCVPLYLRIWHPRSLAIKEYNKAADSVNAENKKVDAAIEKLQTLVRSKDKTLDESLPDSAKELIKTAQAAKRVVGDRPGKIDDIKAKTEKLNEPLDYSDIINQLNEAVSTYETSIKQYKQFLNPSEEFLVQRLNTVDEITDVIALTEETDENKRMNKAHGYVVKVFFESSNLNQADLKETYGESLIERGTDAGGTVEIFINEEDAKARQEYIQSLPLQQNESVRVVGTVVIRTSEELTSNLQKALEEKIVEAIGRLK